MDVNCSEARPQAEEGVAAVQITNVVMLLASALEVMLDTGARIILQTSKCLLCTHDRPAAAAVPLLMWVHASCCNPDRHAQSNDLLSNLFALTPQTQMQQMG